MRALIFKHLHFQTPSNPPSRAKDQDVAKVMNAYWANFAKTGNPNAAGLPEWPAYNAKADILMDFTATGPVAKADPWRERLDLVEKLAAQKK